MKRFDRFFTNVKALQAFHLMRQGAVILVAVLLAKSQLSTEVIGNFEQLLYIGYAVSFFWVAGLIQGLLSSYQDYDKGQQKAFFFNAYLLFAFLSLLLFLILKITEPYALKVFTGKDHLDYFGWFLVYLLLNMPTYLVENFYLLRQQSKMIFGFGFYSFAGHIIAIVLPLYLGWEFGYSIIGLVILAGSKHLWLWWMLIQNNYFSLDRNLQIQWIRLSYPLMLYALLGGLMQTFDNWLINFWYQGDAEQFAIFRYGARELPLTLALASAFSTAMLPEVGKDMQKALSSIKEKSRKLFHFLFPVSILLLLGSKYWFTWVFSDAFSDSILIFNTYLLIMISRLIFSRTILVGLKDNHSVLRISLIEFSVNVLLSFLFIYYWGLVGVAIATLFAFSLEKILLCVYLYRKHKISWTSYTDIRWWGAYSILLLIVYFLV